MQFGVREICEVTLRAKSNMKVGNKIFYKNEPVLRFDSLTTSSMEGAATTVYAQGGRGNARLISWDGERTITFNMTDALLSPESFSVLSGAGLVQGDEDVTGNEDLSKMIIVHQTETFQIGSDGIVYASNQPHIIDDEDYIYVMKLDSTGQIASEPYIYTYDESERTGNGYALALKADDYNIATGDTQPAKNDVVFIDYYSKKSGEGKSGVYQIDITPDKFGGSFYLEAATLFRDRATGKDMPAEFIIPNCRIQSNFTFTMASSGDPSTFDFVMDAFPDYTRFDKTQKVLAEIQIIGVDSDEDLTRIATKSEDEEDSDGIIVRG